MSASLEKTVNGDKLLREYIDLHLKGKVLAEKKSLVYSEIRELWDKGLLKFNETKFGIKAMDQRQPLAWKEKLKENLSPEEFAKIDEAEREVITRLFIFEIEQGEKKKPIPPLATIPPSLRIVK